MEANISGQSLDPDTIQKTLNGNGKFEFKDGAVKGFNLAQMIRDARAAFGGGKAEVQEEAAPQTDFSELSGSFTIKNGLVNNPDLKAFSPLLRVRGEGDVNLPVQKLDYRTKVSVVGSLEGKEVRKPVI